MSRALIGHSGFVGSTLLKQTRFDHLYRSTTIEQIRGHHFDIVVCAGAPAQKWIANKDPEGDKAAIDSLIAHLDSIDCDEFILISTVDVFKSPLEVDETTPVDTEGLHPYGYNRYRLEQFVQQRFKRHLIVRLPGLVGPGLRKNVIYDFLNDNNVPAIDSRGIFQFYPMVNLWSDITKALQAGLRLIHLTAEPISVADIASEGFAFTFDNAILPTPARYDFKSCHADVLGGQGDYQYSRRETLLAIRAYAQSEPKSIKA